MNVCRRPAPVLLSLSCALVANAATTEIRVAIDADNNAATGCSLTTASGTFAGIDHLLITTLETTGRSASVQRVIRQQCIGSTFGAPSVVDAAGWEAGVDGASSNILVETKIPYSAFGGSLPPQMRLAFVMTSGTLSSAVLQTNDGRPVVYPPAVGRRRAVPAPGSAAASRTIILDGLGGDWIGIAPLLSGGASSGSQNGIVNITSDINLVNDSSQMNVTLTNNTFSDPHDADTIWR